MAEVTAWQARPLEPMYPVVFFDALRVKIREDTVVRDKATPGGHRADRLDRARRTVAAPPTRHSQKQVVANARDVLQPALAMCHVVPCIITAWAQDANVLMGSATKDGV
jgi:hypothetical protein